MNKLRSPHLFAMIACLGLAFAPAGCATDDGDEGAGETETSTGDGDGDGDMTGDGDGDMTGDGDGDPATGDGDGDPTTGDGDGDPTTGPDPLPNGAACTNDGECESDNCYLVPFLGGYCGECNEDADCPDGGCTAPNPFENGGSTCNMGELGGGCESDEVCEDGLSCGTVLDLLGLITISTCGECAEDADCMGMMMGGPLCAPLVVVEDFSGVNTCIMPGSLGQNEFCLLASEGGNGDEACENLCAPIDIEGLAEIGACGECVTDDDCMGGTCQAGEFILDTGSLVGATCI